MMNLLAVSDLSVKVAINRCVDAYRTHLQPLTSLLIVRPDGVILSMGEVNLPLFCWKYIHLCTKIPLQKVLPT